ncbi:FAD-binding oxidoreductase [Vicingaceae bacterium]|nr:FAD-binding oxidoreductase [Vicingaceae bacterium]
MLLFKSLSYWEKETFLTNVDYLIVGSGIVGLSTAIHLKKKQPKKKVLVVERGYLPSGASSKNAGFACIGSASELLSDLECGSESEVLTTVEKRWKGLLYMRKLLSDEAIDFHKFGSHELFLSKEKEAYSHCIDKLNYLNTTLEKITSIPRVFQTTPNHIANSGMSGFDYAISNAAEGQVDTGKMMKALVGLAYSVDVKILNSVEVTKILKNEVTTTHGKIKFEKLAICVNGLAKQFLPKEDVSPARAQVIVTSPIADLKVKGIFHFDKGYYYFRNIGDRVLFGGGRNLDFIAEETDELNTSDQIINHLSSLLESNILPHSAFTVEHQWAGIMGVGKGKRPIVKHLKNNTFCGVRLGGMGVAIGTIVGKELSELMLEPTS